MAKQKKRAEKTTPHDEEINTFEVLISGTGNVCIEKNGDVFKIKAEKSSGISSGEKEVKSESEARNEANHLIYSQLANKLEKSIRAENLVFLTGAGASKECGGPSMIDLWSETSKDTTITADWKKLLVAAGYDPAAGKENLEELLSNLETITHAYKINNKSGQDFTDTINKIKEKIRIECKKVNITDQSSHVRSLTRILKGRSLSTPRLKVFTLNYDTAFEQAANKIGAVVIDGFLFSSDKSFKSIEFDLDIVQREKSRMHYEENFYNKVFHLYKIHGSIDWDSNKASGLIVKDGETRNPVLIYPNSSKFERSFEMPFFEMISRLQSVLRKENTTLFIVGYGFGDEHINRIIDESIRNNLNLEIFIIKPTLTGEKILQYIEDVKKGSKSIHLIGNTFEQFSSGLPDVKFGDSFSDFESTLNSDEEKSV